MRRLVAPFVLLVVLLPAAGVTAASAYDVADSPEVRAMDGRIASATAEIDRWNRRLGRWQVEIGRASASVQRLTYLADSDAPNTRTLDVVTRGFRRTRLLDYRLARAHEELRRLLHDPEARNAEQQVTAWSAYVDQLVRARARMIRKASRGFSFVPGAPVTYEAWASGFLDRLDAPRCDENLVILVTWETSESTAAAFNPLATTHAMEGATDMNSVGVKNYVSLDQGLDASRDTLSGGASTLGYAAIVDSLQACAPAEATAAAINASAWCRGCTGGLYVSGLLPIVRGAYADHAGRLISTTPA
jgi:hypothetical protein